VKNLRQDGDNDVVDVRTSHGDGFQLAVSRTTKLPARVSMLDSNANSATSSLPPHSLTTRT
jgi:hypothetical protein